MLQCLSPVSLADIANQLQLYSIWLIDSGLFLNTRLQAAIPIDEGWPRSSHHLSLPQSKHHPPPPHFQGSALSWPFSKATSALLPPFQRAKACQGHRRPLCCQNIPQPSLASEMLSIFLHSSFSSLVLLLFFDPLEEGPSRLVATHQPRRPYAQTPHWTDDETETQRRCKFTQARPRTRSNFHSDCWGSTGSQSSLPRYPCMCTHCPHSCTCLCTHKQKLQPCGASSS